MFSESCHDLHGGPVPAVHLRQGGQPGGARAAGPEREGRGARGTVKAQQFLVYLSHSLEFAMFSLSKFLNQWNLSLQILPLKRNEAG